MNPNSGKDPLTNCLDDGLEVAANDFDSSKARVDRLDHIERKINSSSTDIDDIPSKNS